MLAFFPMLRLILASRRREAAALHETLFKFVNSAGAGKSAAAASKTRSTGPREVCALSVFSLLHADDCHALPCLCALRFFSLAEDMRIPSTPPDMPWPADGKRKMSAKGGDQPAKRQKSEASVK